EKSGSGHTARLIMELCPEGQELFLVRDFRDMYCSMLQFSQRRQTVDFGWQPEHADDYMDIVAERVEQLRVSFENRVKQPLVLRYEDLLTKPRETLQQLLSEMNLSHNPNTIEKMVNTMNNKVEGHQTSKNAHDSIQRWKKELNRKQRSRINKIMRQSLSTFGYEVKE
ncbi:MAG: sulfotransferase, partial [Gammaproteobacteria bacterium]|nr:sulfotransferase [Gammaproteobacteria bacterium]MDX2485927.1 sulfotransferase [Gammaproteobacteria bacterium]